MDPRAQAILDFWLDELEPAQWYKVDAGLDATIRDRFAAVWAEGLAGGLDGWLAAARPSLALVVLLDQFPRNMFRGSAQAFASDRRALITTKAAIARGFDLRINPPARQFFYLPLMHSELLTDQDRAVRLCLLHLGDAENLAHARAHREIIRRFGRFPYRNEVLGRTTTPAERSWLDSGGYGAMMDEIEA